MKLRLLRIGFQGHLKTILNKFGTYDPYFDDIVSDGFFVRYSPDGTFDGMIRLKKNFYYAETNASKYNFFNFWKTTYRIHYLVKKFDLNLIHINSVKDYPWIFSALSASKLLDVPIIASIHSDFQKREYLTGTNVPKIFNSAQVVFSLANLYMRTCDAVCPIRHQLKKYPRNAKVPEERIYYFPHSVNYLELEKKSNNLDVFFEYGLDPRTRLISHAGRFDEDNYIWDVFHIIREICQNSSDYRAIVCGKGTEFTAFRNRVKQEGLEDKIIVPGYVDRYMAYAIRKASAFNLCLMGGFSLIEACMSGNPVISYNVEWHSQLIEHNETGILLPEGEWDEAVNIIQKLDKNDSDRQAIGEAGKKRALEKYSPEQVKKRKRKIYQEVLRNHSKNSFFKDTK